MKGLVQRAVVPGVTFSGAPPTEIGPDGVATRGGFFGRGAVRAAGAGATTGAGAGGIDATGPGAGEGAIGGCGAGLFSASIFELRSASWLTIAFSCSC
ncbi:hypothetical protein XH89_29835 [Bradyrhizobium sp. CCBAU 53340]|nr:hypothetical protein XH89_29835 [Bradyrhizobium sp. CCBAU 53340]